MCPTLPAKPFRQFFSPSILAVLLTLFASAAPGQTDLRSQIGTARHVIVPQSRAFSVYDRARSVEIEHVDADVSIVGQTARTTIRIELVNTSMQREEAILLLPVPQGAVVSEFDFQGASAEPTARLLPADEARRLYDQIVSQVRDPALLEFAGYNQIRSSVFPVDPLGRQRVRLTYEHILPGEGDRFDYVLPRSESIGYEVPWRVRVNLHSAQPISMVFSPSHELEIRRLSESRFSLQLDAAAVREPGSFRLSYLLEHEGINASLLAYPDPTVAHGEGGYFLLMAGLPPDVSLASTSIRREVTLVIDRSGSMAGEKLDQVRSAALQIIEGLNDGEAFNIIDYATTVSMFASRPVIKNRIATVEARHYLAAIRPRGGTNIHAALIEALRPKPRRGMLPMVLFLTDGLPTVGTTSERAIREMVEVGNRHGRRVYTFGVGDDVNAPLLDRLAELTRGVSTNVVPGEDIELKVAAVFKQLSGPVLSDVVLRTHAGNGQGMVPVEELIPARMPDLFEDDRLIVLGRYRTDGHLTFQISGNYLGRERSFEFSFDTRRATTRNAFVPRLWASRRIAELIDQIRQIGAPDGPHSAAGFDPFVDPRTSELAEAVLQLSTEFGILTEYTAFLATEGTDLSDWNGMRRSAGEQLRSRAVSRRSGRDAVSQSLNVKAQKGQTTLNHRNSFVNDRFERVEITNVQQLADRAFYQRDGRWVDARLVGKQSTQQPVEVISYGSPEFQQLLERFVTEGRQGLLSLSGEIVIHLDGRTILVRNAGAQP